MSTHVVDQIMGSGKTSAAINFIKNNKDNKYIYITPYLNEVERITKECEFSSPMKYTSMTPKIVDLKNLLNKGKNVVTTHALFSYFDDEVIDLCYSQNYTLFLDEVHSVVEPYVIKQADLETMLNRYVDIQKNGLLKWRNNNIITDKYANERRLCELESLAVYEKSALIWTFPVKVFKAFREAYILTYMFGAQLQKYYYDFYGLEYDYMYIAGDSVDTYRFSKDEQNKINKYDFKSLIKIVSDDKLNMIGDLDGSLSKKWYLRNSNNILIKQLKNNLYNFFNNRKVLYQNGEYVISSSANNMWTTFSDYKKQLGGKGYSKGFIPSNMRATNEYRDKTVVAYTINKYFNPVVKNFFVLNGIEVDEDGFATSEMLQFIWRSGIRDGKHITIYIPSLRMRKLLQQWIDNN